MRIFFTCLIFFAGCAVKHEPELDPLKTQQAIWEIGAHVIEIEKRLGISYPTPVPEGK